MTLNKKTIRFLITAILSVVTAFSSHAYGLEGIERFCNNIDEPVSDNQVTNDKLSVLLLDGSLQLENIEANIGTLKKTSITNTHHENIKSYVASYHIDEDYYYYYVTNSNSFPLCLRTSSPKFLADISKKLSQIKKPYEGLISEGESSIVVSPSDGGSVIELNFDNGLLISMSYLATYVD